MDAGASYFYLQGQRNDYVDDERGDWLVVLDLDRPVLLCGDAGRTAGTRSVAKLTK